MIEMLLTAGCIPPQKGTLLFSCTWSQLPCKDVVQWLGSHWSLMSHIIMVTKTNRKQSLITYITEFIYLLIYMNVAYLPYSTHLIFFNWLQRGISLPIWCQSLHSILCLVRILKSVLTAVLQNLYANFKIT
jgi:hypothetical protein